MVIPGVISTCEKELLTDDTIELQFFIAAFLKIHKLSTTLRTFATRVWNHYLAAGVAFLGHV